MPVPLEYNLRGSRDQSVHDMTDDRRGWEVPESIVVNREMFIPFWIRLEEPALRSPRMHNVIVIPTAFIFL